jgi:hypothetical protein
MTDELYKALGDMASELGLSKSAYLKMLVSKARNEINRSKASNVSKISVEAPVGVAGVGEGVNSRH